LADCRLELHPQKTRIVYCKDSLRRRTYPEYQFDFLGFPFRPRKAKDRFGRYFTNFTPAASHQAAKAMRRTMRRWALHRRSDKALDDLARMFNPVLPGRRLARGSSGQQRTRAKRLSSSSTPWRHRSPEVRILLVFI
jgi:RNA-directed DNA polymerase